MSYLPLNLHSPRVKECLQTLNEAWETQGLSEQEKQQQLKSVESEIMNIYAKLIEEEKKKIQTYINNIDMAVKNIRRSQVQLDLPADEKINPYTHLPLRDQERKIQEIEQKLNEKVEVKKRRNNTINETIDRIVNNIRRKD